MRDGVGDMRDIVEQRQRTAYVPENEVEYDTVRELNALGWRVAMRVRRMMVRDETTEISWYNGLYFTLRE